MRYYEIFLFEALSNRGDDIRKYLTIEYWRLYQKTPTGEIWRHWDDPDIGSYHIQLASDGLIEKVSYQSTLNKMFNRDFETLGQLIHHISVINNDDWDEEERAKGSAKLNDIAAKLKKKRDEDKSDDHEPDNV